jgi:hypothetical protein
MNDAVADVAERLTAATEANDSEALAKISTPQTPRFGVPQTNST